MPADIAFIYNALDCVRQLTAFFEGLDAPFTFTFTVVDNASGDGSQEFLQAQPEIHYIQTGENIGYGRAINRGVAATASKYVCVTNSDVILNREALVKLWRFLEERADAGVCAPRITWEDGRDQGMAFTAFLFSHYALWFAKIVAARTKRKIARASAPVRVDGVLGAFFLIRRSAIPAPPALFDEDFFFFYEDTALAHALKIQQVPCFIVPDARIIHIGGKSRSAESTEWFYESKYLYLRKFYGPFHARAIYFQDRARILRKWLFYSLVALMTRSERVKFKRRHYKIAWNAARLK